jgi:hypothetical protein
MTSLFSHCSSVHSFTHLISFLIHFPFHLSPVRELVKQVDNEYVFSIMDNGSIRTSKLRYRTTSPKPEQSDYRNSKSTLIDHCTEANSGGLVRDQLSMLGICGKIGGGLEEVM